jgi:hypothetical protein
MTVADHKLVAVNSRSSQDAVSFELSPGAPMRMQIRGLARLTNAVPLRINSLSFNISYPQPATLCYYSY